MNAEYIINITGRVNNLFVNLETSESNDNIHRWNDILHGVLEGIDILLDTLDSDDIHVKVLYEMMIVWNERLIDFWNAQVK